MQILPLSTPLLTQGDDLASLLCSNTALHDNDIVVLSSKALATVEGDAIDLSTLEISDEATQWAEKAGGTPAQRQAVLQELKRMNGRIVGYCPNALLTELKPDGLEGAILCAGAGIDASNTPDGTVVGWPLDPVASTKRIHAELEEKTGKKLAVLLTDSCVFPMRKGVSAFALVSVGLEPFMSEIGKTDLFGKKMVMTVEAVADQLATAANAVMGNGGQCTPAAIIRDHDYTISDYAGWVPGMDPEEDLFRSIVR